MIEIDRLRNQNEEHRSLVRLETAFQRRQQAYLGLNGQWSPHSNGVPTDECISEAEAAEEEFRASQVEVHRITKEIGAGGTRKQSTLALPARRSLPDAVGPSCDALPAQQRKVNLMEIHDRQDCEGTIRRIEQLLASEIFEPANRGHALLQSAFIELMICLRDLLFKAEKYAKRISFTDDVLPNGYVKDITDCVTAVRDAACHINSFKQLFDDRGNRGSFNVAYGKCNFMRIGDLELKSEYEDDFAVFYGANRLYFRRGILRAYEEARNALVPILRQR